MNTDFVRVAAVSDLADGEMKHVKVNDCDVLLARVAGEFHAVTAFCTHFGAPLETGVLDGCRVVCPWHHAVFDVTTGALEGPPALDALQRFPVRVENGEVLVRIPEGTGTHGAKGSGGEGGGIRPVMESREASDDRTFAILGAGAAAQAAAEELRHQGFGGKILMITPEEQGPYDRTSLSKGYLAGNTPDEMLPLRDGDFYNRLGITLRTGTTVTGLHANTKTLTLSDGMTLSYDCALAATGAAARRLPVEGADLDGVFVLRSWADAKRIVRHLGSASRGGALRAVVVGASFIGMEAASNLIDRGLEVTVVGLENRPFQTVLGAEVGRVFQDAAEEKGVTFRLGHGVQGIARHENGLRVTINEGEALEADVVVMGVGVEPATEYAEGAPFRRDDGGLLTDECLRVTDGLFAAGDIAAYPAARLGEVVRIEHWRLAQQHGRAAARNMLGAGRAFREPPFFWTGQFGVNLRYVGHVENWDDIIFNGSFDDGNLLAYYVKDDAIRALAAIGRDKDAAAFHRLLLKGDVPTPEEARRGIDLQTRLHD